MLISHSMHTHFMRQALQMAESRRGFCAPNPAVGAVIVKDGTVIAKGTHWACGYPHAEVDALKNLAPQAQGATLYVTLEPCAHHGRTPPCTDLIIQQGITEVIYAVKDPNPHVAGNGASILQQAGISCQQLHDSEAEEFYRSYRFWLANNRPLVTLKLAMSLDGKIAGPGGKPVAITGQQCQEFTHWQRLHADAILTTATTIIADNPRLNVRLAQQSFPKPVYVLDSHLRLPSDVQILKTAKSLTVFYHYSNPEALSRLTSLGVICVWVPADKNSLNLRDVLNVIGKNGCHDLWVEAGGQCFQSFFQQKLAQRIFLYVAPKILSADALSAFSADFSFISDSSKIVWRQSGLDVIAEIIF